MNQIVNEARRAASGTWDGTTVKTVSAVGMPRAMAGSPLWILATLAFLISGSRRYGSGYLVVTISLIVIAALVYGWLRAQRRRQAVIVGRGVIVLRKWNGRPHVLRVDTIGGLVLTRVRWGRVGPPLLLALDHNGTTIGRMWGAEWDRGTLSEAVGPLGITVEQASGEAGSPRDLERRYPGSMNALELHPLLAGFLIPLVAVTAVSTILVLFGAGR